MSITEPHKAEVKPGSEVERKGQKAVGKKLKTRNTSITDSQKAEVKPGSEVERKGQKAVEKKN